MQQIRVRGDITIGKLCSIEVEGVEGIEPGCSVTVEIEGRTFSGEATEFTPIAENHVLLGGIVLEEKGQAKAKPKAKTATKSTRKKKAGE